ncbi:MAG: arylsulfatase [Deltaproteobacteria bacterium]|jgi:arylsulfatase A-like enzyme|nr:arylsulfatase [Deltaproteobacteria bacterium]
MQRKIIRVIFALLLFGLCLSSGTASAKIDKPNIVVIWGDDIGRTNISEYSKGMMGYHTPNIDRVAKEGILFTDAYADQSCTAGRSSFLTGQSVFRTGLSKVGMPGAKQGISAEDPTIATLMKQQGYVTGQFGKNHLGDRNEHLPTVHGFDEFYGSLYHLNASEEPEQRDYPKDPEFLKKYGPRGVLDCVASDKDDPTTDPRAGKMGKQVCKDTGPLTKKRMETVDDEIAERAQDFIKRQHKAGKTFFTWINFTHMHFRTHAKPESMGQSGIAQSEYHDAMIDHDKNVGSILDLIDELGIADNTIVLYSTDNGPHRNSWPDAGTSPFRNEKNTGWEGAYRVPSFARWPGKIKAGTVSNEIISHLDWLPTLIAAAGEPQVKEKLLKGYKADGKKYKVHLDGYNFLPYLTGQEKEGPRKEFFYFSDDGDLMALRYNNWKVHFMVQDQEGTLEIWQRKFRGLRMPYIFNLRTDPYEQATITSNTYWDWYIDHAWILYPLPDVVGKFLATFKEYPPRMKAGSFTIGDAFKMLQAVPLK